MKKLVKITALTIISAIPALILVWKLFTDQLGANPVEYLEHATGDWTIYFLFLTLSITPLQNHMTVSYTHLTLPTTFGV